MFLFWLSFVVLLCPLDIGHWHGVHHFQVTVGPLHMWNHYGIIQISDRRLLACCASCAAQAGLSPRETAEGSSSLQLGKRKKYQPAFFIPEKENQGNIREYGGIARGSSRVAVVINCQSVEDVLKMLKSRNVSYRGYAFVFQGETEANSDGSMPQVLASCA